MNGSEIERTVDSVDVGDELGRGRKEEKISQALEGSTNRKEEKRLTSETDRSSFALSLRAG